MKGIKTTNQFDELIDEEFTWRLKEIALYKSSVKSSSGDVKKVLVRAGIPLIYAHWEGFVKEGSQMYLDYVVNRRLKYSELKLCFTMHGVREELSNLLDSKKLDKKLLAIESILKKNNENARFGCKVNTKSNLKSNVFDGIALSIGVNTDIYKTKYNFIDETLLKSRNTIAHGKWLCVEADSFLKLADEVIGLIRLYKNDLQNSATNSSYKI